MKDFIKGKSNSKHRFLVVGAAFAVVLVATALFFFGEFTKSEAGGGFPTHNHVSWTCSTCGTVWKKGDSGSKVTHIQEDLFLLGVRMKNWSLPSDFSIDGYYGSATEEAVTRFQNATGILVDGIVGNQTLAQMETSIFAVQSTYNLRVGPYIRFLMWNDCVGYDNGGSSDIFVPIRTSGEYKSFKNAMPDFDVIKDTGADCEITGGGSGGTDDGGGGGGGTDSTADTGETDGLMWRCHWDCGSYGTGDWVCGSGSTSGGITYSNCSGSCAAREEVCSTSCNNSEC